MTTFLYIFIGGVLMSSLALVGWFTTILSEKKFKSIVLPMVSLSAGSLLGGAIFHMLPSALEKSGEFIWVFMNLFFGFVILLIFEQFLHWHHCHKAPSEHKEPVSYMLLFSDSVHNFIGGVGVASAFMIDINLGIITWIAAALHEIPQEFGDFGILVHGGWKKSSALFWNFLSATTFLFGGLLVYFFSPKLNLAYLTAFAAGNFIYIAAADLIPEFKKESNLKLSMINLFFFIFGVAVLFITYFVFHSH
jgi:zinc and cadmium transporter